MIQLKYWYQFTSSWTVTTYYHCALNLVFFCFLFSCLCAIDIYLGVLNMDSLELMKHATTIKEMSKQVKLNKRQFQRESFDLFHRLIFFFSVRQNIIFEVF